MADWGLDDLSVDDDRAKSGAPQGAPGGAAFGVDDWATDQAAENAKQPAPNIEDLRARGLLNSVEDNPVGAFMGRAADMMTGGISDEFSAAGTAALDWLASRLGVRPIDMISPAIGLLSDQPMPESPVDFGDRYNQIRADQEAKNAYLRGEYPASSVGGDVTGLVVGAPGKALDAGFKLASKAPTMPLRAALYSLLGGAEGGALGFTTAEGGLEDRMRGSQQGAVTGGVTAGVMGPALEVGGRLARQALPKNVRPNQTSARITNTLADEGMSPQRLAARLRTLGDDAVPADATPGLRQLLDDAVNRNRTARSFAERQLTPRQEKLGEQVIGAARTGTGAEGKALASAKAIADSKRAVAAGQLPKAREAGFAVTDDVADLLKRPTVRNAYDDAVALAADEGVALPALDDIQKATPNDLFDAFDYMRKALNKRASIVYDGPAMANADSQTIARAVNAGKLAKEWREALKGQNAPYAQYLADYADEFANEAALKLGQTLWRTQAKGGVIDEMDDMLKGMSEAERAYLREGLVQSVRDSIETGSITGDAARRVYKSQRMRDIFEKTIKAGLPEETAKRVWRDFDQAMKAAIEKAETFRVLGGSQTARRMQGGGQLGESAMSAGEQALVGDRVGAVRTLLRNLTKAGKPSAAEDLALTRSLLDPNFSIGQLYAQRLMGTGGRGALSPAFAPLVEGGRQTSAYGLLPVPQAPR